MNFPTDPDVSELAELLQHVREACLTYAALVLANTVEAEQTGRTATGEDKELMNLGLHAVAHAGHAYIEARRAKAN